MRLRRIRRWWPVALLLVCLLVIYAAWPGRSTFTISPETTHVTGPVDADGFIDYPAALNERLSRQLTPDENVNVLLWQAIGPRPEGAPMPPEYFRWLGAPPPPDAGDYFINSDKYFDRHVKREPPPDAPVPVPEPVQPPGEDEDWIPDPLPPDPRREWTDRMVRATTRPWQAADNPELIGWLRANEKPLAVVAEAVRRPKYYQPVVPHKTRATERGLTGILHPNAQLSRAICNALCCRAMNRTAAGDHAGAWQDLLTCRRLGRHLATGSTLVEALIGFAIDQIGTNAQLAFLSHTTPSAARVRGYLADLRALPPLPDLGNHFDLGERFHGLDALTVMVAVGPAGLDLNDTGAGPPVPTLRDKLFTRNIHWDPAYRNMNRMYDEWAAAVRLTDRAARKAEVARLAAGTSPFGTPTTRKSGVARFLMSPCERGDWIGGQMVSAVASTFERLTDVATRVEQIEANLHVAFALAAYRADTGRYPAALAELAPKYLAAVPGDLFTGGPLVYNPSADGYQLYSVGANGRDEEGRWFDDAPAGDDVGVRMPREK